MIKLSDLHYSGMNDFPKIGKEVRLNRNCFYNSIRFDTCFYQRIVWSSGRVEYEYGYTAWNEKTDG